jgi:uncharacterized protein (DUF58 family)
MIVPQNRLLIWFAVLALPLSAGHGLPPPLLVATLCAYLLLAVIATIDAILGKQAVRRISVHLPELVRFQKDREAPIEIQIRHEHRRTCKIRIGLPLPAEFDSPEDALVAQLPAEALLSRITWPCTPGRRGLYRIDQSYFEIGSPLGFWQVRGRTPAATELRVYPDLLSERKNVAALFLNRGDAGIHLQRQSGKGREFEKLREYLPSDSISDIHWKASAKRNHPVTKVFQIERTQELYVLIDNSRLSARMVGNPAQSTLERFVTSALVLAIAAEQQGDTFGLLVFDDKVRNFVRARSGKAHFAACRDALYTAQPRLVTPDYAALCSFIRLRLRKRALLVVLTSLDDPLLAESFTKDIELVSRQHLVLVNMLQPEAAKPIFTDSAPKDIDQIYQRLGGHHLWHKLKELQKVLQRRGVSCAMLDNEKLSAQLVSQYLNVRALQLVS